MQKKNKKKQKQQQQQQQQQNVSGKIAAKTSMVKCLQRPVTFSH